MPRKPAVGRDGRRALFLVQHPELPSSRVRVLNLLQELCAASIDADVLVYPSDMRRKIALWRQLKEWPVVVLQKKLPTPLESALLRRRCRKLVYDFDDAVYCQHESANKRSNRSRERKFWGMVTRADLILAGNRVLARAARQLHDRVEILPSAVEVRNIPQHHHEGKDGPCVIGWVGGTINLPHLVLLRSVLEALSKTHRFELRILSGRPVEMGKVPTRFIPWDLKTQEQEIAAFDIGLMPLPGGPHAAGKCGYKALQYMAAGVPPVVSDTETNRDIITHEINGLIAPTPTAFGDAIARLIENPSLRNRLGEAARERVEQHYSIPVVGARLAEILLALLDATQPYAATEGNEP